MDRYTQIETYLKKNQFTWLITGVAGFIGSNLLEKLLILNQKVVGIDNFETGYDTNIAMAIEDASLVCSKDLKGNFTFINGDITSIDVCIKGCKNVDYVLHQAALGSVPRSIENPIKTNNTNIDGFLNMLVASKDAGIKRFVYAASSSTYGDHPDLPKEEDKIGSPLSPYAVTKVVNELYSSVFSRIYGFQSIGLRYLNVFGKRQDPNGSYAAVIPRWISSIINNDEVYINGDGKTSRDFCYIDNVIQINLLAAMTDNNEALNQVYNVALNNRTTLNKLYEIISEKIIEKIGIENIKKPIYLDHRPGDVKHSQGSFQKAKDLLGYDPKFHISHGLDKTIDWYLKQIG